MLKSNTCGELSSKDIGRTVTLAGWVHRRRDHGGLIFIDIRDRWGLVQVVFNPEYAPQAHDSADKLRNEFVIKVTGKVERRPAGTENLKLPTGEVEVLAQEVELLNPAKTPPFYINEDVEVEESLRLKYRYLDLRRPRMQQNLILRHEVVKFMRDFLNEKGFIEVETPILIKSTPEGARDYLVPSRLYPGRFYALPQSPQQLKQLLMVAGIERYFQIARCFRDEDLRADRQPEFTQLDLEMSFVDEEDILSLMEELFIKLVEKVKPEMRVIKPFPRLTYEDCMARFGVDKPDIRFGLELKDITGIAVKTQFSIFRSVQAENGVVKAICVPGCSGYSRKQLDEMVEFVKGFGAKGLVTMALPPELNKENISPESIKSAAAKFLTTDEIRAVVNKTGAKPGDLVLIVAGKVEVVNKSLVELRGLMAKRLGLMDPNLLAFAFVVDFPLFEWNPEENRWQPMHHPFTAPKDEHITLLDSAPDKVTSKHYDMVCNGYELSSGSIRIHRSEIQEKVFRLLGYTQDEIKAKFGYLLEAFEYGAPPHGGIAPGIERLLMLLVGASTIREVMAFPKNQAAIDLMTNAPDEVSEAQLKELHLSIVKDEAK